jgi:hypothetical protein
MGGYLLSYPMLRKPSVEIFIFFLVESVRKQRKRLKRAGLETAEISQEYPQPHTYWGPVSVGEVSWGKCNEFFNLVRYTATEADGDVAPAANNTRQSILFASVLLRFQLPRKGRMGL